MHSFEVTILGSSSATPTATRHPTSQLLNHNDRYFLIDCGEATQIQLRRFQFKIQRIDHILISHLHGDHYLGLSGLLGTMNLLGREKELHIYSPPGLQEIIALNHFHSKTYLKYKIIFHVIENGFSGRIFEDDKLYIDTVTMNHRIPCYGFLFKERNNLRNIIQEKLSEYNIPVEEIVNIKQGHDFMDSQGKNIPNSELTSAPPLPRFYAYCSDTIYDESYIEQISNANLLYHEATFASDRLERAKETFHCTATEAATIALKANVKQLIIGHYSARYRDLDILLLEAKAVFLNVSLSIEGITYKIV